MDCRWELIEGKCLQIPAFELLLFRTVLGQSDFADLPLHLMTLCQAEPRLLLLLLELFRHESGERAHDWHQLLNWVVQKRTRIGSLVNDKVSSLNGLTSPVVPSPSLFLDGKKPAALRRRLARFLSETDGSSLQGRRKTMKGFGKKSFLKSFIKSSGRTPFSSELLSRLAKETLLANSTTPAKSSPSPLESTDLASQLQTEKLRSLRLLAYGASHEINNPLANIAMRAENLFRSEVQLDRKKKLKVIQQQAMRAHQMISDLMLFAHPPKIQLEKCSLPELVRNLAVELREELSLSRIELHIETAPNLPEIWIDPKQISESIKALIDNSIQSIGSEGTIRVVIREAGDSHQTVTVVDTGHGISPDILPCIFDPFFSGREAGRGLGFGLSKAWRIADEHGGNLVCVEPHEGQTTFCMTLPNSPTAKLLPVDQSPANAA